MANLGQGFNAAELPQSENNFEPLPAGWYTAHITGAELKDTKAGNGQYISVRYDITGPSHEGRVVFGNINIRNPNPKAEEIGHQQLGELMRAIGLSKVTDTDQLVGGQCSIKLKVRKSEEYGDNNDVAGFKSTVGSQAPSAAPTSNGAAASGKPPWAK